MHEVPILASWSVTNHLPRKAVWGTMSLGVGMITWSGVALP